MSDEYSRGLNEGHAVGFREGAAHMQKAQAARIEQLEKLLRDIYMTTRCDKTAAKARAALEGK